MIKKMGRLPLGSVSPYVKTSSGGSIDPMKFYCTTYGAAYGQEDFRPRNGFHFGAGYKSNYRPVVQYNPNLDKIDNPAVGKLLQDNYESTTNKHFQPLQLPDGKYPLPWSVHQPGSGYGREKPLTFPTTKTVKRVHFDTANQGAEAVIGLEPRHVPVLHNAFGKGSVEVENARHGPQFMSTEYGSKYRFKIPGQPDFLQKKTIGAKEESGFTEGCLANPIVEKLASQVLPVALVVLPVLRTTQNFHYRFSRTGQSLLNTTSGWMYNVGVIWGSYNCFHNHIFLVHFLRNQALSPAFMPFSIQEPSGFSTNNLNYVIPAYDPNLPNRFLTSYNSKEWTGRAGLIQPQQAGGFATNNHGTDLGSDPNATETLRTVHPHVGRAITTVDPFYRDSPHDRHFAALHQTTVPN
uniref:Stabilizer of axonemal microtubules 4 n=1 Tax=Naja naja TaxID=35670 RepID=A0A8C6V5C4_NAJNA